jgi:hypothetical protein
MSKGGIPNIMCQRSRSNNSTKIIHVIAMNFFQMQMIFLPTNRPKNDPQPKLLNCVNLVCTKSF